MIEEIVNKELKYSIAKDILTLLPQWFADSKAIEDYANECKDLTFFVYYKEDEALGFISLKIHHKHTGEIMVMGVKPSYRQKGIGRLLFLEAKAFLKNHGCNYILVKTLDEEADYKPYEETRGFYKAMGFKPLITIKEVWGKENPCLVMIKPI